MEADNDKITIRLELHDHELVVTIPRQEEELTRRAGRLVNETVNGYSQAFAGQRGREEILYMALLNIALRLEKQADSHDTEPYEKLLSKLTSEIEDVL